MLQKYIQRYIITETQYDIRELKAIVLYLSASISDISNKIDQVETNVTANVAKMVDVKIDQKFASVKNDLKGIVNSEIGKVRNEFERKLKGVSDKVNNAAESMSVVCNHGDDSQIKKFNIVIRNLKEHSDEANENGSTHTLHLVNALMRDGLKLKNIKLVKVERKFSRGNSACIVIATLESLEDKQSIMKNKNKLQSHRAFEEVYIDNDLTRSELETQNSLNSLIR